MSNSHAGTGRARPPAARISWVGLYARREVHDHAVPWVARWRATLHASAQPTSSVQTVIFPVNLILFEPAELSVPLPRTDPRAVHVLKVLRRSVGDTFDAGLVNGPRGKGTVAAISADTLTLTFSWETAVPTPEPISLLIGLPRPQTARDILREATSLGAGALHFFRSEKGEASYAQSTLWSSGEWRRYLITGAEQAFDTRLPAVTSGQSLAEVIAALPSGVTRIALDNYESPQPLSAVPLASPVALAFGPERGWSAGERDLLRARGFAFAHLGTRVLRSETAVIAALAVVRSRLGLL
jgi:RsmE family RNA methyltransferase